MNASIVNPVKRKSTRPFGSSARDNGAEILSGGVPGGTTSKGGPQNVPAARTQSWTVPCGDGGPPDATSVTLTGCPNTATCGSATSDSAVAARSMVSA